MCSQNLVGYLEELSPISLDGKCRFPNAMEKKENYS